MPRMCVSAIRVNNIIFYRNDLTESELDSFIKSNQKFAICAETKRNNIFFDERITLFEWDKYKVLSIDKSFVVSDFTLCGEYGSSSFGFLQYKNCCGETSFKNIKLIVESYKISNDDMKNLLDVVNKYISSLSFDFNQATFSKIGRIKNVRSDIEYHKYLLISNFLDKSNKNNFYSFFNVINNNKYYSDIIINDRENINFCHEIDSDSIIDSFSSGNEYIECSKSNKLSKKLSFNGSEHLPKEIIINELISTYDNPENRFVKFFVMWMLQMLYSYKNMICQENGMFNYVNLRNNLDLKINSLKKTLNNSFLRYVGKMSILPYNSNILNRRDGYRQLFSYFIFTKCIPYSSILDSDFKEVIENKNLDLLYEEYCYFSFVDIISNIYGEKIEMKKCKIRCDKSRKFLEKSTNSNYFVFKETKNYPKIEIHYNKNYTNESYSKAFDPDISIEIYDSCNALRAIYVFDSKFKLSLSDDNDVAYYKFDDITKMHAYKDALKHAIGAFILYPGTENKIYYEDDTNKNMLNGVGAFSIKPGLNFDNVFLREKISILLKEYK